MGIKLLYKIDDERDTTLVRIEPLCAGAEVKCRDRVLGKGEKKIALSLCQAKEGQSRLMP